VTNSHWGSILQSGSTKELAEEFRKNLVNRMSEENSAEALKILHGIREELLKELSAGRRIPEEIGKLIETLPEIRVADELKISRDTFLQLATELFTRRSSVSSAFTLARSFYDRLITTAFDHTIQMLEEEGRQPCGIPYAVLVSGEMGREESILGNRSRLFFIYRNTGEGHHEDTTGLAIRFMAVLSLCFPAISRNLHNPSAFWHGSDAEWLDTAAGLLRASGTDNREKPAGKSFSLLLETVADMRLICGNPDFGQNVIAKGRKLLLDYMKNETFRYHANTIATMPVAIGIFGRFKTVRSGKNRGKFDLKEMAIDPLAAAVRILSLTSDGGETSFSSRIKSILASGNIGVSLADRLLIAYQDFMRERIKLELTGATGTDGLFLNPDELDETSKERFREGLEYITTLQRLVHQQLVEVKQR